MKASGGSAAGLVLAGGIFCKAELYAFALAPPASLTLYFTTWDVPLTVGGHTYLNTMLIKRGAVTQKAGVEVQTLDLELVPQVDAIVEATPETLSWDETSTTFDTSLTLWDEGTAQQSGGVYVSGIPFLQACRLGFLDSCRITMSKLFMATPGDVSAGAVPWFQGRVSSVEAGRFTARVQVESDLALLNIAMPRNLIQTGCTHRLFDAGCTLNASTWTVAGTIASVSTDRTYITSGLTQANGWFDLGVLTFNSGPLAGVARSVKASLNASGKVTFMQQLPLDPVVGSTFSITPGCDKLQATCSGKFNNLSHFRGYPYVPVPETMYAGGVQRREGLHGSGRTGTGTSGRR